MTAYGRSYLDGMKVEAARRRLEAAEALSARVKALYDEGRRSELELEDAMLQAARARQKLLKRARFAVEVVDGRLLIDVIEQCEPVRDR